MKDICAPKERRYGMTIELLFIEFGFLFTRLFVKTRITPNQITLLWGILLIFSSVLFIFDNLWLHVAGAIGWIVACAMDNTDGQVARYKKMFSKRGLFLDKLNHSLTYPLLFFCIGLGQYMVSGEIYSLIFGFMAGTFMMLSLICEPLYALAMGDSPKEMDRATAPTVFKKRLRSISPLFDRNLFLLILVATILDLVLKFELLWMGSFLEALLPVYAIGFLIGFLTKAGMIYKMLDKPSD